MVNKTVPNDFTTKTTPASTDKVFIVDLADNSESKLATVASLTAGMINDTTDSTTTFNSSTKVSAKITASEAITNASIATKLPLAGGTLTGLVKGAKSTDIASATTTDLSTATGNYVHITGTTTITGFGTVTAGTPMPLVFDGILTLTYNATSMKLPTNASITTAAGDSAIFVSEGSGNWKCVSYTRASGSSLFGSSPMSQSSAEIYGASTTGNDTYVVTLSPVPASYTTGMVVNFKADTANTGACTINVNGLGAKSIKNRNGSDPRDGDVVMGMNQVQYDGTNFVLMNLVPPKYKNGTATGNTTGTTTIAHGLGRIPDCVEIEASLSISAATHSISSGAYDSGGQNSKYQAVFNGAGTLSNGAGATIVTSTGGQTGTLTLDTTNLTITWAGTSVGFYLLWKVK